jgi:hypothetical protein
MVPDVVSLFALSCDDKSIQLTGKPWQRQGAKDGQAQKAGGSRAGHVVSGGGSQVGSSSLAMATKVGMQL